MKLNVPDPNFIYSERSSMNFAFALKLATGLVGLLWVIHFVLLILDIPASIGGVVPRTGEGLMGLLTAPLVHGGIAHLASNTVPLWVLTTALLYLYPNSALRVLPMVWIGGGAAVWVLGRSAAHIGASGVVYGLAAYVFVAGLLRRDVRAISVSLLVYFLYGTLIWGVLPIQPGMSFESHAAGATIGVALAFWLRDLDRVPRKRYDWEAED